MKKVAIFLATGFEESEAIITIDVLRRADIMIDIISSENQDFVQGSHNIIIQSNYKFNEIKNYFDYDMLILPGGGVGVDFLQKNNKLIELLKQFHKKNKYIAAICAAPQILGFANLVEDKEITVYPECKKNLKNAKITLKPVVVDENIITSPSMGCAIEFALKLVALLINVAVMEKVRNQLVIL